MYFKPELISLANRVSWQAAVVHNPKSDLVTHNGISKYL